MKHVAFALAALLAASCAWAEAIVVRADDARISRMGRAVAQTDGGLRFGYPGVRLALSFTGSALSFDASSSGDSYLDVAVDKQPPRVVRLSKDMQTVTLAGGPGVHKVEILHRSEAWHGIVTVARFTVDGKLLAAPPLPKRKMLVLGDSVTCGEAIDRVPGEKKNPAWWNARQSYGMLAAQALDAQAHLVCHGGRGLVRSWNKRTDEANLGDFYEMAIAAGTPVERWDHAAYQPDLILSAIGTNDFSPGIPERAQYVDAYVKLVHTLLRNHPKAQIVLTEGAILNGASKVVLSAWIAETVKRVGSARVRSATSAHHPGDASDGHPTREQHAAMARELLPHLRKATGW